MMEVIMVVKLKSLQRFGAPLIQGAIVESRHDMSETFWARGPRKR